MAISEDKKDISEDNFDLIFDEIQRQYDICRDTFSKTDLKAQFVLGIIVLIFGYIYQKNELLVITCSNSWLMSAYYIGLWGIFCSGILAYICYRTKSFKIGQDLQQLLSKYKENSKRNYKKIIGRGIYEATISNIQTSNDKSAYFEWSIAILSIGTVIILIFRIAISICGR